MVLLISKTSVYTLAKEGDELSLTKVGDVPCKGAIVSAASGPKSVLYYACEEDPSSLRQWNQSSGADSVFVKLPTNVKKVRFYRNKIYCAPVEGTCLLCVDPLNLYVDQLDTHHGIVDFEPSDHGFVIETTESMLISYHFNFGSCKVTGICHAELRGQYKRYGVAVSLDQSGPFGVNEKGEVLHPPTIPSALTECFVVSDDVVYLYHRRACSFKTLDGKATCAVPADLVSEGIVSISAAPDQENEDVCTLCFCEFEGDGDGVTLDCGHSFHKDCVMQWVSHWDGFKEKGNHVVFTNAVCPGGCKHLVRHPLLGSLSDAILAMFTSVTRQSKRILASMPATKLDEDLLFYVCSKCKNPFYGGEKVCFRAQGGEPSKDPADLVCDKCQVDFACPTHAREFVVYKCFYCCNPATERSFGNRYLCERCSARWTTTAEPDPLPCPGAAQCPIGGNGHSEKSFPIGCLACLSDKSLDYNKIVSAPTKGDTTAPS